jgi:NADPH2:quinone reductase
MSRAAQLSSFGGIEAVELVDREPPVPAEGEVRVRVRAAAIHPLEALIAGGGIPFAKQPPLVLGAVGAGEVETDGKEFRAGDRVAILGYELGMLFDGIWADHALVPERLLMATPPGLDFTTVATLGIAPPTAAIALRLADVSDRDSVLVLGASGAVGSAAIQLARAQGLRVTAASRSQAGCAFAARLGADETVDLSREDFAGAARRLTDGGFDAIIDPIGGGATAAALEALRPGRTHVVLGYSAGFESTISLPSLVNTSSRIQGAGMASLGPRGLREVEGECLAALVAGELEIPVAAIFGLDEIAAAFATAGDPAVQGRVLLEL